MKQGDNHLNRSKLQNRQTVLISDLMSEEGIRSDGKAYFAQRVKFTIAYLQSLKLLVVN